MAHLPLRAWLAGVLLGGVLTLTLTIQSGSAACDPNNPQETEYCSTNFRLMGGVSAVAGSAASATQVIVAPQLPPAGAFIYDDYKRIEAHARGLLQTNAQFRESISPHKEKPAFDQLIQNFDYTSGFNRDIDTGPSVVTIQDRLDQADRELRQARDEYAFLAVFAPQARLRQDLATGANPVCPAQPRPDDPLSGDVDWCNFPARLRQSVREAAYLRMIFGQQFTVDALGFHFSGLNIVGGEAFVRDEVKKLQLAVDQYREAETSVTEGLAVAVGNGCLVSDFYTQAEWALLSRAAEGKERAEHEIATRLSYLDATGPSVAAAAYRGAGQEGFVKLVAMAGQAVRQPTGPGCQAAGATRPDGTMLAELVANILETRDRARTQQENRNIFGFDVSFTPARPYRTSFGSDDTGLLNEARSAVTDALNLWDREVDATREYDRKLERLQDQLTALNRKEEYDIQAASGCDRSAPPNDNDDVYFKCIDDMIQNTAQCDPTSDTFDDCMARTTDGRPPRPDCSNCLILVSTMRQSRQELRGNWLAVDQAQKQLDNNLARANAEDLRNTKVKSTMFTNAQEQATYAFFETMANCCQVQVGTETSFVFNPGSPIAAALQSTSIMRQAVHDMEIEDANKEATIRNLVLDRAELEIDRKTAVQAYQAKLTEYNGVVGQLQHDVNETRRQRAWIQASPANDPSYRLVRDSARLALADQLEYARRVAYLAARRAEYEYAARLNVSGFRISDIYRTRTAEDIRGYLMRLEAATNNILVQDSAISPEPFTLSVAQHILGLTDARLGLTGAAAEAERVRRFREWVAANTRPGPDGQPMLAFDFSTSLVDNGIFSQVILQGYDQFWLHKIGGLGQPKPSNTGMGINLKTAQTGTLGYRRVVVTEAGLTHLRTRAGCIFEYRLISPAALAGQEWPSNQPAESATALFRASVNGANGVNTPGFLGRPVSSSAWQVEVRAGAPEVGLLPLDLQQLTDVELNFSTTFASRAAGNPDPRDCVRADF